MARPFFQDDGARRYFRHAREAGHGRGIENGWHECFVFNSLEEQRVFEKLRPDLYDRSVHPRDLAERWKAFGQTSEGRALRVR